MEPFTTEAPWYLGFDEELLNETELGDYMEMESFQPTFVAAISILMVLGVVSGVCLFLTVFLNKTLRSTITGVLLMNMAVITVIDTLVLSRWLETEARGGNSNMGQIGCFLYMLFRHLCIFLFDVTVVALGLDVSFGLPSNKLANVIVSLAIWVISLVVSLITMYGFASGPKAIEIYGGYSVCTVDIYNHNAYIILQMVTYDVIPTILLFITMIKLCCFCGGNKNQTKGKILPFIVTSLVILVTIWGQRIMLNFPYTELLRWMFVATSYRMAVSCLTWLLLFKSLRDTLFCRGSGNDESDYLLK